MNKIDVYKLYSLCRCIKLTLVLLYYFSNIKSFVVLIFFFTHYEGTNSWFKTIWDSIIWSKQHIYLIVKNDYPGEFILKSTNNKLIIYKN